MFIDCLQQSKYKKTKIGKGGEVGKTWFNSRYMLHDIQNGIIDCISTLKHFLILSYLKVPLVILKELEKFGVSHLHNLLLFNT
jgi:hypothetical protein